MIRGAIIDDDDFPVDNRKILLQSTANRLLNEALMVKRIDHHANKGFSHSLFTDTGLRSALVDYFALVFDTSLIIE